MPAPSTPQEQAGSTANGAPNTELSAESVKGLAASARHAQGDTGNKASGGASASLGTATVDDVIALLRKGSFKTGEFWFFVVSMAVANALAAKGVLHGNAIGIIDAVTPFAYQWLRQNFKDEQHWLIIDLLATQTKVPSK
jgi:hypothetical protein